MSGFKGNDVIFGGGGTNDSFDGGEGADRLEGGLNPGGGSDYFIGGLGNDIMNGNGGQGDEFFEYEQDGMGNDTMTGGSGNDSFSVDWECWELIDGYWEQVICHGQDTIYALGGDDYVNTYDTLGDDFVDAGEGNDSCYGDDPAYDDRTDVFVNCEP